MVDEKLKSTHCGAAADADADGPVFCPQPSLGVQISLANSCQN